MLFSKLAIGSLALGLATTSPVDTNPSHHALNPLEKRIHAARPERADIRIARRRVLPHIHQRHYENFFKLKGRYQLWAQKGNETQQSRVLGAGDYEAVPRDTAHTFRALELDTEMLGVIAPGGFEQLFFAQGTNLTNPVQTAYVPQFDNETSAAGPDADKISSLEAYDVYAQLDFEARTDLVDGAAPSGTGWHTGYNDLGEPSEPYFIANGWGPKYLNSAHGCYQIVAPLATGVQTGETHFTMATVSISAVPDNGSGNGNGSVNVSVPVWEFDGATAFQVLEGRFAVTIAGHEEAELTTGDVVFIPSGTSFRY
ncbi:RmlC-like cupin domain-containing protein [Aspergillus carlsbadensis]|nr:RmlC-like cupin domain-containing protein [Aspergillus carlsbadensis]